jgi:hypothetical protein
MVVPLDGSHPFFGFVGCFDFAIVDAVEAHVVAAVAFVCVVFGLLMI